MGKKTNNQKKRFIITHLINKVLKTKWSFLNGHNGLVDRGCLLYGGAWSGGCWLRGRQGALLDLSHSRCGRRCLLLLYIVPTKQKFNLVN